MDSHNVAHYGAAGVIAAGLAAVYSIVPAKAPTYPDLPNTVARAIVEQASESVKSRKDNSPIWVMCSDKKCKHISRELLAAGKSSGIAMKPDYFIGGAPDDIAVGAPTQPEADALKDAVEKASAGTLHVSSANVHGQYYISFGPLGGGE